MMYPIDIKHLVDTILAEDRCTTYMLVHLTDIPSRTLYNIAAGKVQDCSFSTIWKLLFNTGRDFRWLEHYYRSYCSEIDKEKEKLNKLREKEESKKRSESDATDATS